MRTRLTVTLYVYSCLFGYTYLNAYLKHKELRSSIGRAFSVITLNKTLDVSLTSSAGRERTHSVKQNNHNYSTSTMRIK